MTQAITFHDDVPAIDVKDRHVYGSDLAYRDFYATLGEKTFGRIYEECVEQFWIDAGTISEALGYGEVNQEGRSGGWLTVTKLPDFEPTEACEKCGHVVLEPCYDGPQSVTLANSSRVKCEDCGYEQDSQGYKHRAEWLSFERQIEQLMVTTRQDLQRALMSEIQRPQPHPLNLDRQELIEMSVILITEDKVDTQTLESIVRTHGDS